MFDSDHMPALQVTCGPDSARREIGRQALTYYAKGQASAHDAPREHRASANGAPLEPAYAHDDDDDVPWAAEAGA